MGHAEYIPIGDSRLLGEYLQHGMYVLGTSTGISLVAVNLYIVFPLILPTY